MNNILSDSERAALLQALNSAPDEILIDAVRQRKDWMKNIKSSFDEVRAFVGMKMTESVNPPPASAENPPSVKSASQETAAVNRVNMSPGASAISKIGSKTKDELFAVLKAKRQPNHDKWGEHLKLLWARGELCFDGKEYYMAE